MSLDWKEKILQTLIRQREDCYLNSSAKQKMYSSFFIKPAVPLELRLFSTCWDVIWLHPPVKTKQHVSRECVDVGGELRIRSCHRQQPSSRVGRCTFSHHVTWQLTGSGGTAGSIWMELFFSVSGFFFRDNNYPQHNLFTSPALCLSLLLSERD